MLDAAGDTEGFEKAATRLKPREARLKEFAQDTGRTVKSDRVQAVSYTHLDVYKRQQEGRPQSMQRR